MAGEVRILRHLPEPTAWHMQFWQDANATVTRLVQVTAQKTLNESGKFSTLSLHTLTSLRIFLPE